LPSHFGLRWKFLRVGVLVLCEDESS
jgi:hypothetical protein